ncbi:glycosyltransferase family 4 protein [Atopobiaceae bacterium 24-176]
MRILNVSAQKPDSTGSGTYLSALVRSELAAGHEAAVVCGIDDGDPLDAVPTGAAVYPVRFRTAELPFHVCGMSDVMPYPATRYRDLTPAMEGAFVHAFSQAVRGAVAGFRPDVVVCHHLYLATSVVREVVAGIPVVAVSHSTDLRQLRQHALGRDRIVPAVRALDGVCALHDAQVEEIAEVFSIDPAAVTVVGVGYDPQVFHPDPAVPRDPGSLLFVGKVCRAKGVPSLLSAVSRLEREGRAPSRLRLAGGWGSAQAECDAIRAAAEGLSTPVEFLGRLDPASLAEQYREADTFVLPSFFEGLPLVAVEALACGCKAVLTDLPGVRPWFAAGLPDAPVRWVVPPTVTDVDKPRPDELPAFEERLALQLAASLADPAPSLDATTLSWDAVLGRVLSSAGMA